MIAHAFSNHTMPDGAQKPDAEITGDVVGLYGHSLSREGMDTTGEHLSTVIKTHHGQLVIGLIGVQGAGKSTFVNTAMGDYYRQVTNTHYTSIADDQPTIAIFDLVSDPYNDPENSNADRVFIEHPQIMDGLSDDLLHDTICDVIITIDVDDKGHRHIGIFCTPEMAASPAMQDFMHKVQDHMRAVPSVEAKDFIRKFTDYVAWELDAMEDSLAAGEGRLDAAWQMQLDNMR